ncbi:sensor histidine kinase [Nocardia terpenica]|uniref:sensor histidine kinase n=1 Tax=Nocardia terpenica TaxID=455432 RepID=UPI001E3DCCF8|nr:ATP-binding protein [Nocardia terpenica]
MQRSIPPDGDLRDPDRPRPPWSTLLATALIGAVLVAGSVLLSPTTFRLPMAIGAGAAALVLCIAITAAVRAHALERWQRQRAIAAQRNADAVVGEATARVDAAYEDARQYAARAEASEKRRAAAMSSFAAAAARIQAMTNSMLAELREAEERHAEDPDVLAELLRLDHRTAQAGRLADSISVLSGARSGRRWAKPIGMESILRGAMGRVAGYRRIRLRAIVPGIAVAGHGAEGVMHVLAELLDNACNFSPPHTEVHVYASEVPAGVVVHIEDSGLIMSESTLRRAEQAVSGRATGTGVDLSALTGTRLGLAVVGHLARKHALTVSYRPSAIGGTAVVVVVPRDLIVRLDYPRPAAAPKPAALPQSTALSEPSARVELSPPEPENASGRAADSATALPRRQRGSTLSATHPEGLSGGPAPAAPPRPVTPTALGAFQRAVSGRDTDTAAPAFPSTAMETD